ncbi:hypothetical protein D3C78_874800 [compost metagenome]
MAIELDFIGHHVQAEVALVVLSQFEVLWRYFGQAIEAGARLLAAGDVERVQQEQPHEVVLKQRVGAAVLARAFGEDLGALVAVVQQHHPAVEAHVLIQQA